jgi:hypothetical protein
VLRPIAGKSGSFYVEEFDIVVEASDILGAIVNGGLSEEQARQAIYARARDRKVARDGYAPEPPREFKVVDERKKCAKFMPLRAPLGGPAEGVRCELPANHEEAHTGIFPNDGVRYRWSGSKVWTDTDPFAKLVATKTAEKIAKSLPADVQEMLKEPEPEPSPRSRALAVAEELEEERKK